MYDLIIKNAFIVDGSGTPGFQGDVAITGDEIAAVGPSIDGPAKETLDAEGKLLTPGWVDHHTHYDGQVTWDPYFTPSGWHGVTTVVMGNCGVGFAPCKESQRDWLVQVMEGVEDIPGTALHEGIEWGWETFPEYMDFIEKMPHAIDFAVQVPHAALRAYVMGERSAETNAPTKEELAQMVEIIEESVDQGALGFSTSRTPLHKSSEGVLVAGTHATTEELFALGGALAKKGACYEIAADHVLMDGEVQWMKDLATITGGNVIFNLSQIDQRPELYKKILAELDDAAAKGLSLYGQCAGRSIGIVMHLRGTAHPFVPTKTWQSIDALSWEEKKRRLADPEFRTQLLAEKPFSIGPFEDYIVNSTHKMFPMRSGKDYEPSPEDSIAALAEAQGRDAREIALELLIQDDCEGTIYFPLFNYSKGSLESLRELHAHPRTRMGLADGGAHCGAICDGGMPTFMLTHWTRDRVRGEKFPLEYIVMRQTSQAAELYGLSDRGRLAPGYKADLNLIDYDNLHLGAPRMVDDLPANGRRLVQRAKGYLATIVSGQFIVRDGEQTGGLPGKLVRGKQSEPSTPAG